MHFALQQHANNMCFNNKQYVYKQLFLSLIKSIKKDLDHNPDIHKL